MKRFIVVKLKLTRKRGRSGGNEGNGVPICHVRFLHAQSGTNELRCNVWESRQPKKASKLPKRGVASRLSRCTLKGVKGASAGN
jgi:hypothetical protein